jgi:hypothetical protein
MPKEKKKNIDFDGLAAFTKKGYLIVGIILMFSSFVLIIIPLKIYCFFILPLIPIIGIMIVQIKGLKYIYNVDGKNILIYYVYFGLILFIVVLLNVVLFYTIK